MYTCLIFTDPSFTEPPKEIIGIISIDSQQLKEHVQNNLVCLECVQQGTFDTINGFIGWAEKKKNEHIRNSLANPP